MSSDTPPPTPPSGASSGSAPDGERGDSQGQGWSSDPGATQPYGSQPPPSPYGSSPYGSSPYGSQGSDPYGTPPSSPYGSSPYGSQGQDPYGTPQPGGQPYGSPSYPAQPSNPYGTPPASYPQPGYPQQGYGQAYGQGYGAPVFTQPNPPASGMAIAAMVVGIVSIPLLCLYGLGLVGGIVAVALGFVARSRINKSQGAQAGGGMALTGIICGALAILIGVALIVLLGFAFQNGAFDSSSSYDNTSSNL